MAYRALYRVFRPQTFDAVRGQTHISTTLKNAIRTDRLAHAYLFCGPRGTGKTSTAKILAKAVNCLDLQDGEPCNRCDNCRAINADNFLDVLEIDAASNRGIDEIRVLRDKIRFAPSQGKRKVYIIDEVHMLTNEAFNALLKTLEEPPAHVLFILATTEPQKIPLTILSRCQRFDFHKIGIEEIEAELRDIVAQEQVRVDENAISAIARNASGGLREAISVLDQCIAYAGEHVTLTHVEQVLGTVDDAAVADLLDAVTAPEYPAMFRMISDFLQQGKDIKLIMRDFTVYCRQLFLLKAAPDAALSELAPESIERAKAQAAALPLEFLGRAIRTLSASEKDLRYSNQPQIVAENALITLMLEGTEPRREEQAKPQQTQNKAAQQRASSSQARDSLRGGEKSGEKGGPGTSKAANRLVPAEQVVEQWELVMNEIKTRSIRLHALMINAQPVSFQNGELLLRFPSKYQFHYDTVRKEENLRLIAQVVGEMTGVPAQVALEIEKEEDVSTRKTGVVEDARKLFGDVPIEITD